MPALTNPYSRPPGRAHPWRRHRVVLAGGGLLSAALVAGCSSAGSPDPAPPRPDAPPATNPLNATTPIPAPDPTPSVVAPATPPAPSPAAVATDPDRPAVPGQRPPGPPELEKPGADYQVGRGDTLSDIAVAFDTDGGWRHLWAINCDVLRDPHLILPGQQLDLDGPAVPGCS